MTPVKFYLGPNDRGLSDADLGKLARLVGRLGLALTVEGNNQEEVYIVMAHRRKTDDELQIYPVQLLVNGAECHVYRSHLVELINVAANAVGLAVQEGR